MDAHDLIGWHSRDSQRIRFAQVSLIGEGQFLEIGLGLDISQIEISEKDFAKTAIWFNGGIDISDPEAPIINKEKLKNSLGAGKFYLLAKYNSEVAVIEIDITTSIDIANRDAVVLDKNDLCAGFQLEFHRRRE